MDCQVIVVMIECADGFLAAVSTELTALPCHGTVPGSRVHRTAGCEHQTAPLLAQGRSCLSLYRPVTALRLASRSRTRENES
jgi:hypothetical protein